MRKFTCFTLGLLLACAVTVNAQEQKNDQEGYKFTDIKRLPTTSVKSQDRAGTCWSWSTISFLESEIMRMGKDSLSLSPMYVVWNTYHAKGDKYVRMNGLHGRSSVHIYLLWDDRCSIRHTSETG